MPPEWIDRGHTHKVAQGIEAMVEWVEARERPFTTTEALQGARRGLGGWGLLSYSTGTQTIRSLRRAGLIVCLNPGSSPPRYIRCDLAR